MLLQVPGRIMAHDPDCEWVATIAPPRPSTSSASAFGVHTDVGGRSGFEQPDSCRAAALSPCLAHRTYKHPRPNTQHSLRLERYPALRFQVPQVLHFPCVT